VGVPWSRDPLNFWALNANSSETVKADFKFNVRVSRYSPDMTLIFFGKGSVYKNSLGAVGGSRYALSRAPSSLDLLNVVKG